MRRARSCFIQFLTILLFAGIGSSHALTAYVRTPGGTPIFGAAVTFSGADTTVYSDVNGYVVFIRPASVLGGAASLQSVSVLLSNRKITISLPVSEQVDLRLYAVSGRAVFSLSKILECGTRTVAIPDVTSGIYVLTAKIGAAAFIRKINSFAASRWMEESRTHATSAPLSKTAAGVDTAVFVKPGFQTARKRFVSFDDNLGAVILNPNGDSLLVKDVSAGKSHTMILLQNGALWATGDNSKGQLGDGTTNNKSVPVIVSSGVSAVSAGGYHTMVVKQDGTLWAMGSNTYGQLGNAAASVGLNQVQVLSEVLTASAGLYHTMILKKDGTLWATGFNRDGELGTGDTLNRKTPVQIMSDVAAVSTGFYHTMIVKQDGTLWATGNNSEGQLGDGTTNNKSAPVIVLSGVSAVSAGGYHTMVVKQDGTLWAMGSNASGEIGNGTGGRISTPIQIVNGVTAVSAGLSFTLMLKQDNTVWATGSNASGQCGDSTGNALSTFKKVMSDVATVSAGSTHSMMLKRDGTLWATGYNSSGQLGDGAAQTALYPKKVFPPTYKELTVSGGTGSGSYMPGVQVSINANDSTAAHRGFDRWGGPDSSSVLLLSSSKTYFTMPNNDALIQAVYGDLHELSVYGGSGSGRYISGTQVYISSNDSTSVKKAFNHWGGPDSAAVLDDTLKATSVAMPNRDALIRAVFRDFPILTVEDGSGSGSYRAGSNAVITANDSGAARKVFDHWGGPDSASVLNQSARASDFIMPPRNAFVKARYRVGCVVTYHLNSAGRDSTLPQTGLAYPGRSLLSAPPRPLVSGYWFVSWNRKADGSGEMFTDTSIIAADITVYAQWTSVFTAVSAGGCQSMAIAQGGDLWVIGGNSLEPLGFGSVTQTNTPVRVMSGVSAVSAGNTYTFILKQDGTLWGTGSNRYGGLGVGTIADKSAPVQVMSGVSAVWADETYTMILKQDGTLWGTGLNEYAQLGDGTTVNKTVPVLVMSDVATAAVGEHHTMIVKKDGTLWATGRNSEGQLGDGTTIDKTSPVQVMSGVSAVSAGDGHTMILKQDGTLWGTGYNKDGDLGTGDTLDTKIPVRVMSDVLDVSAGYAYSMILKQDGTLWATGQNTYGELGDGTTANRHSPIQIMSNVAAVSSGVYHTLILKKDGSVWATGDNYSGQLGDGTTTDKHTPFQVMPTP